MSAYTSIENKVHKLSNGQLVDTALLEQEIKKICHYVQDVTITVKDEKYLTAIIFPNRKLFSNPDYQKTPEEGCFCPRNLNEIGKCLSGCMNTMNLGLLPGYAKINSAVIINTALSVEDGTLTPALGVIDDNVIRKYKDHLDNLYGGKIQVKEEVFNMQFN